MTVLVAEFDHKAQRASCREGSLSKSRAQFKKQSLESHGRIVSAAPSGSDFATPHRAARAATRSRLAKGSISASSDMPQISMGRAGHWVRWVRKPSVSKIGKLGIGGLEIDETIEAPRGVYDVEEDSSVTFSGKRYDFLAPFDMNVDDRQIFPELVPSEQRVMAKITNGAWSAKLEKESVPEEEKTTDLMLEGLVECSSEEQHLELEEKPGTPEDWIFLSSADVINAVDANVEKQTSKAKPEQDAPSMDWSVAGMPSALLRRIIRGSVNTAHHSMHSDKKVSPVPLHIVRAQSRGSSKRQRSTPKSPRSQSKPLFMR